MAEFPKCTQARAEAKPDSRLHDTERDWLAASNALAEAQVEAFDALLEFRRRPDEATRLRMARALDVRDTANARMRALFVQIWSNPL